MLFLFKPELKLRHYFIIFMSPNWITFQHCYYHAVMKKTQSFFLLAILLIQSLPVKINEENYQIVSNMNQTVSQMFSHHSTIMNFGGIVQPNITPWHLDEFINYPRHHRNVGQRQHPMTGYHQ
jgi:hypothetical protein